MNIVALMGRLTADPEIRKTQSDISVCSFTIAVDRYSNGESHADFINCVAFRNTADNIARFFGKGQLIGISGSIQTGTYQDKETGKNRTSFKVIADRFYFAQNSNQQNAQPAQQTFAQPQQYQNPQQFQQRNGYGQPQFAQQTQQFPTAQGNINIYPAQQNQMQPNQQYRNSRQFQQNGFQYVNDDDGDLPF